MAEVFAIVLILLPIILVLDLFASLVRPSTTDLIISAALQERLAEKRHTETISAIKEVKTEVEETNSLLRGINTKNERI